MDALKDWDFVRAWAISRHGGAGISRYVTEVTRVPRRKKLEQNGPLAYQDYLYVLVRTLRPERVIETGVRFGVSTTLILYALERNGRGHLYSCDPFYGSRGNAMNKIADVLGVCPDWSRWTFEPYPSRKALPIFAESLETWDLFVHDSDHSDENMEYELDFAWSKLVPGGLLVCDDYAWQVPVKPPRPCRTFSRFLIRAGHAPYATIGTAAVLEKPGAPCVS